MERLRLVVPALLANIFLLVYFAFGRLDEAALIMLSLPLTLVGDLWPLLSMHIQINRCDNIR